MSKQNNGNFGNIKNNRNENNNQIENGQKIGIQSP
jgi:hypothetical protein